MAMTIWAEICPQIKAAAATRRNAAGSRGRDSFEIASVRLAEVGADCGVEGSEATPFS